MRLLVITQKYDINDSNLGAFVDWWDKLAEKMEKVYILALLKRSEPTMPNMEVISMGKEKGAGFSGKFFGFYRGLFKTIGKTDVILAHMIPKYVFLAAPIAFLYRKPIYLWYTGHVLRWDLRLAVFFCRKIFTAHKTAMRVDTSKRIVTGHGIDVEKFKIPTYAKASAGKQNSKLKINESITVLSVGRITPSKGHDLIIKAIANLVKDGYNIKLKVIGDVVQKHHQKYADFLKKLAADSGAGNRVEFTAVPYGKMPEYFTNAEILINAVPFFGGLDKVVLEAMASGIVPLTSNNAFLSVFPEEIAPQLVFKEYDLKDLENKLKNVLDKKLYLNEVLANQLRDIVVRNHNLDNLISKIIEEIKK